MAWAASRLKASTMAEGFCSMAAMSLPLRRTMQRLESVITLLAYLRAAEPMSPVPTMTMTLLFRMWVRPTSLATSSRETLAEFLQWTCQREKLSWLRNEVYWGILIRRDGSVSHSSTMAL